MKQIIATILFFIYMFLLVNMYIGRANAQAYYVVPRNAFQEGYDAACPGCSNGNNQVANAILLAQRNQQEFIINQQRAAQGLPPCSLAPLGLLIGKTAC